MRRGWHSRGYLPHFDGDLVVQHVVFRLNDSLPDTVVAQLRLLGKTQRLHRLDAALDAGAGSATLSDPNIGRMVVEALQHFDGERYMLLAWCVMPNHVHVLVEPLHEYSLGSVVKSWKAFTATQANRMTGRSGQFWAPDYFDRFMRDDNQLSTTIAYIENNPVAAGLVRMATEWPFSSASVRGEQERA